jgi:hypothetical protein
MRKLWLRFQMWRYDVCPKHGLMQRTCEGAICEPCREEQFKKFHTKRVTLYNRYL